MLILSVKETLARSRALRTKRRTSSNSSGPTGGPPFCTTRQQQESASKDLSPQIQMVRLEGQQTILIRICVTVVVVYCKLSDDHKRMKCYVVRQKTWMPFWTPKTRVAGLSGSFFFKEKNLKNKSRLIKGSFKDGTVGLHLPECLAIRQNRPSSSRRGRMSPASVRP